MYIPLQNVEQSFTQICDAFGGEVLLADYCRDCCCKVRTADRVAKAIEAQCPGSDISVEQYGGVYELLVYRRVKYTTAEALHEAVLEVAHVVDVGAGIARDMLGGSFDRFGLRQKIKTDPESEKLIRTEMAPDRASPEGV